MAIGINPEHPWEGVCKCSCFTKLREGKYYISFQFNPFRELEKSSCYSDDSGHLAMYLGKCYKLLTQVFVLLYYLLGETAFSRYL